MRCLHGYNLIIIKDDRLAGRASFLAFYKYQKWRMQGQVIFNCWRKQAQAQE